MSTSRLVMVHITLEVLRNFLDHVAADAGQELEAVEERNESGAFELDDYEAALEEPLARMEIAARAVQYELLALVESQLYQLALTPWQRLPKNKDRPLGLLDLERINSGTLRAVRQISDEKFPSIVKLVERHYQLTLVELPFWSEVTALRSAVNVFKHNSGFRRLRDIDLSTNVNLIERYRSETDDAYAKIDAVGGFFAALVRATTGAASGASGQG